MIQVRLEVQDGGHVADVTIPPFQKLPDVLVWGQRFFQFHGSMAINGELRTASYREVFAYWVPPGEYEPDAGHKPAGG